MLQPVGMCIYRMMNKLLTYLLTQLTDACDCVPDCRSIMLCIMSAYYRTSTGILCRHRARGHPPVRVSDLRRDFQNIARQVIPAIYRSRILQWRWHCATLGTLAKQLAE